MKECFRNKTKQIAKSSLYICSSPGLPTVGSSSYMYGAVQWASIQVSTYKTIMVGSSCEMNKRKMIVPLHPHTYTDDKR